MGRRWKPSKSAAREFAQQMKEIESFCEQNNISSSASNDSYYFTINNQRYRVSNHTVEKSNQGAYDHLGNQTRDLYHDGRKEDIVYIHASKTRIIEIYNNLKAGKKLDGKGNVIIERKQSL